MQVSTFVSSRSSCGASQMGLMRRVTSLAVGLTVAMSVAITSAPKATAGGLTDCSTRVCQRANDRAVATCAAALAVCQNATPGSWECGVIALGCATLRLARELCDLCDRE